MDDETTLRTAAEATMAAHRDALGAAPTPEELLAFRDGTLPADDRGLIEEKVAAFPEAAATLLDLARFPDVPAAPGVREVSDEEIARDWRLLRDRMVRERRAEAAETARAASRPGRRSAALLAAGLLVGVIGGALLARGPLAPPPTPTAGSDFVVLLPDGSPEVERGGNKVIAPGAGNVLVLAAGGVEPRPAYAVAVLDDRGRTVWSHPPVAPNDEGLVTVELPPGYLEPGRYRVALSAPEGGAPLATFPFSAAEPTTP